jgi:uncharacterized protein
MTGMPAAHRDRATYSEETTAASANFDVADAPLPEQVRALDRAIGRNLRLRTLLGRLPRLELPGCYVGAGAVAGTVWNVLHGFDPGYGIKDYDVVYFDPDDLTPEAERSVEQCARALVSDMNIALDVTNEARVHVWYPQRFGRTIPPYDSTERAISTWPTTATSIGVRYDDQILALCAPFGLHDLFSMVVRPNKTLCSQADYEEKAARWARTWPKLRVLAW